VRDGISVVVPVYNGAATLRELVRRTEETLVRSGQLLEIILVNDGSTDSSWEVICELAGANPRVRGISLMRNYGQHCALLAGIRAARGEITVTIDDDLQNPPEEIPKLLAKLAEGHDVVYGPAQREQHGLWRDLASRVTKLTLRTVIGVESALHASAFRAFRTVLREAFADYHGTLPSIDVMLSWGTRRFAHVHVEHAPRAAGKSNYTFWRLLSHAITMITGFSALPLRLATLFGFAFTLFGVAVLIYVVGRYLISGTTMPGFPFLASIIAIFSGIQLFTLGIYGEYLARMHYRLMDRPTYAIREQTPSPPRGEGEEGR
jgi:undecaprenyl-phosphate 4-deoxy-4-formamido-L-arabinose transferase